MDNESQKKGISPAEAVGIVWDVLFGIAIPTVFFALLGRWLDRRTEMSPLFLVLGLVCALGVSGIVVYRKAKRIATRL